LPAISRPKRSKRTLVSIGREADDVSIQRTTRNPTALYLNYLRIERGLSPNSLEAYERDIQKLESYLAPTKIPIIRVSYADLQKFLRELGEVGMARASIVRIVSGLRGFYKFLLTEKIILHDPTENLDVKSIRRKLPDVLSIAEIEAILTQPDVTTNKGVRDRALLEFLYATGARASEATDFGFRNYF
jgi:integrase/recombinase XerD